MVVAEPVKKSEYSIFFGPLERDEINSSQDPAARQLAGPPTLRNFSYPTKVAVSLSSALPRGPPTPSREPPREIPNTYPDSTTIAAAIPGDSCLDQTKRHPRYSPGEDLAEAQPALWHWYWHSLDSGKTHLEESTPGRRPRRSTLLSSNQPLSATPEARLRTQPKTRKSQSWGDRIIPHVPSVAARLRRNSVGKHQTTPSLDVSPFAVPGTDSSMRPVSSSGILAMNQLPMSIPSPDGSPPPSLAPGHFKDCDMKMMREPASVCLEMNSGAQMSTPRSSHSQQPSVGSSGRKRGDSTTEDDRRKGKSNRGRWLSQLKGWVSTSEPSAQAFKQHKKETYKRAGLALDDPRANAKLHISTTTLPPSAIKPSGPGPEPEEIARRKAENRRKRQHSVDATRGTSRGSRSSASQRSSSSSSFAYRDLRNDA